MILPLKSGCYSILEAEAIILILFYKDPPKLQIFHCWPYLKPILELKLVMNERTGSNLKNYLKTNKWEIQAQTSIT